MFPLFNGGNLVIDMFEELKEHEGYKEEVYKDHLGYLTVGIGHKLTEDELKLYDEGDHIHPDTVNDLFEEDLEIAMSDCEQIFDKFEQLPYVIQKTLVNMCFNVGSTRLRKFKKMRQAVAESNWDEMANEMVDSRWYNQVGRRSEYLVGRVREYAKT